MRVLGHVRVSRAGARKVDSLLGAERQRESTPADVVELGGRRVVCRAPTLGTERATPSRRVPPRA